jgi:hypothetical protein
MVAAKAHAIAENIMKLVRFDGGKTGLMVQLAAGTHVIDVIGSLGVLSPDDPISQGILNGILKDKGNWAPLIAHWGQARVGLRRLESLALATSDRPNLVLRRAEEVSLAPFLGNPRGIVTLDIIESSERRARPDGARGDGRAIWGSVACRYASDFNNSIPGQDTECADVSPASGFMIVAQRFRRPDHDGVFGLSRVRGGRWRRASPETTAVFRARRSVSRFFDVAIRPDGLLQSGPDPASETARDRVNVSIFPQI